jgi:pantoate--beta-alanine ligase
MAAIADKIVTSDVKIGLVSTQGAIHPGHLSLIQNARKMADLVVVSIFVNRPEFSSEEEYQRYPRDVTNDTDLLRQENVDYVFMPADNEMYPVNFSTYVEVRSLGSELVGLPMALFNGMATGALKLLHITKPSFIFFGEKDAFQGAILRKMIRDLNINTEVIIMPVVREASGLAYAGRNRLLTGEQIAAASVLYRSLKAAESAMGAGETHAKKILAEIARVMNAESLVKLQYAFIADPETLEAAAKIQGTVIIGVGGRLGSTSLSDAILLEKLHKA